MIDGPEEQLIIPKNAERAYCDSVQSMTEGNGRRIGGGPDKTQRELDSETLGVDLGIKGRRDGSVEGGLKR